MRWYVTPANNSVDGCVCEKMSDAGGPTLAENPLQQAVAPPDGSNKGFAGSSTSQPSDAASSGGEDGGGQGPGGDQAIIDALMMATFEELLSPVREPA